MAARPASSTRRAARAALPADAAQRFLIEGIAPAVEGGRFAVKRIVNEPFEVEADLIGDPHARLAADLLWRPEGEEAWRRSPMRHRDNDRWAGAFTCEAIGRYVYAIEAWLDEFATWRDGLLKKAKAGQNVSVDLEEGRRLIARAGKNATGADADFLRRLAADMNGVDASEAMSRLTHDSVAAAMRRAAPRLGLTRCQALPLTVERREARFAAWYEMFWRSQGTDPSRGATIDECIARLPYVRDLGFDTVYFVPIHPIGHTNRKGRNNSLVAGPDDPGSPYAIGMAGEGENGGGHMDVNPEWGTLADFRRLVAEARAQGLEVALDFAIQCSPDHPWIKEHPDWFRWRPDGTIKYAENPPKRYEDIVNVEFYDEAGEPIPALWLALRDVVQFWIDQGVLVFRVDNPHTKPLPFWAWLIDDIQSRHPDAIFLAEAFTRPKLMKALAKLGFTQSYSYFTWREEKEEIRTYLEEIATPPENDVMRANFFTNTPDILPRHLQEGGRPAFLQRVVLAATLSSVYGIYNGFELCENAALPGKEEYLDSEKYQYKVWDWDRPGHIKDWIRSLNRIRRENPALTLYDNLKFYDSDDPNILIYGKITPDRTNFVLAAVNLDPHQPHETWFDFPLWELGLPDWASADMEELFDGYRFRWTGKRQHVWIDNNRPAFLWRVTATAGAAP